MSNFIQKGLGISDGVPTTNIEATRPESEHSAISLRLRTLHPRSILVFVAERALSTVEGVGEHTSKQQT